MGACRRAVVGGAEELTSSLSALALALAFALTFGESEEWYSDWRTSSPDEVPEVDPVLFAWMASVASSGPQKLASPSYRSLSLSWCKRGRESQDMVGKSQQHLRSSCERVAWTH